MISFRQFIKEGNPLSRNVTLQNKGLHSIIMSPERKNRSPEENKAAAKHLEKSAVKAGYGFRKALGKWKGEEGEEGSEKSYQIIARNPGAKAAAGLRQFGRKLGKELNQQAIIHVDPAKKTGTAIQTVKTPEMKVGQKTTYGTMHHNVDNPYGETQYRPQKPEKVRPKITFQ